MKKAFCFILLFGYLSLSAQPNSEKRPSSKGDHTAALSINLPLGNFSSTHSIGFGIGYSPGNHVFGLLKRKHFALTYKGGIDYYMGKKETVSGYPYKYPGYLFIHAFGGVLYNQIKKIDLRLTAGPALGIYNSKTRFNIGASLEGTYHFNNDLTISPVLMMMKESKSDPLWAGSLKFGYLF